MPTAVRRPLNLPELDARFELELDDHSLLIDRSAIRIGSSPLCEIHLAQGPLLHSVLHSEEGVVWIEADGPDADLMVNWRNCRRMALQDGDVISAAGQDMTLRARTARLAQDVSHLSAEELCDRILSEQTAVEEFESNRLRGWQKLMTAIREVAASDVPAEPPCDTVADADADGNRLLDQIREISELMNGRTSELDACESDLAAATALLQETQDRVSRQIEELLDQIGGVSQVNELRVSA